MRSRARTAGLVAIALLALPSAAGATAEQLGAAATQSGPKDYSKNAVTGEYADPVTRRGAAGAVATARADAESALRKRSEALENALAQERYHSSYGTGADPASQARQAHRPAAGESFAWGDAAVGAAVALALVAALAGFVVVRRRVAAAGAHPART